jgi:DNA-binding response OmpR family regulator
MMNGKKILHIDDDYSMRRLVTVYLSRAGVEVESAEDFQSGLSALRGERGYSGLMKYNALIFDMAFPGGSGSQLAWIARTEMNYPVERKIVMLSGFDFQRAVTETRGIENVLYLEKPIDLKGLYDFLFS